MKAAFISTTAVGVLLVAACRTSPPRQAGISPSKTNGGHDALTESAIAERAQPTATPTALTYP